MLQVLGTLEKSLNFEDNVDVNRKSHGVMVHNEECMAVDFFQTPPVLNRRTHICGNDVRAQDVSHIIAVSNGGADHEPKDNRNKTCLSMNFYQDP